MNKCIVCGKNKAKDEYHVQVTTLDGTECFTEKKQEARFVYKPDKKKYKFATCPEILESVSIFNPWEAKKKEKL